MLAAGTMSISSLFVLTNALRLRGFRPKSLQRLARPKGFEPLTPRFVVWCAIQLS